MFCYTRCGLQVELLQVTAEDLHVTFADGERRRMQSCPASMSSQDDCIVINYALICGSRGCKEVGA